MNGPITSDDVFLFGSFYVPGDPLFGPPQADSPASTLWGSETVKSVDGKDWDVRCIEWTIG